MYQYNIVDELIVDNFAGGGGASTGIELATGRIVDIAINHDRAAIEMHEKNHPYTNHFCEDVWQIDPKKVTAGRSVGLVWGSPDCTHFSKAKGGTPVSKRIRGLAWVLIKWAGTVRPRVIIMENVEEFVTWGPVVPMRINGRCVKKILDEHGKLKKPYVIAEKGEELSENMQVFVPDKKRAGQTFRRFVEQFQCLGYKVEWKVLTASGYGAPTSRKRFFLIARCDGRPIVFPEATHGKGKGLKKEKAAADCIDFLDLGKSIFKRKKPLATNTMKRIARGLDKFVIKSPNPFIMSNNTNNIPHFIDEPLSTITTGNRHFLCSPSIMQYHGEKNEKEVRGQSINEPLCTVDTSNRYCLSSTFLSKYYSGENQAGSDIQKPLSTITSIDHNALVAVNISSRFGNGEDGRGRSIDKPLPTVTSDDHNQLLATHFKPYYSEKEQHNIFNLNEKKEIIPKTYLIAPHICTLRNNMIGQDVKEPLSTITAKASHHSLVSVYLTKRTNKEKTLGFWSEVREMLNKYAGYNIADDEVLIIDINNVQYFIFDITMRMLKPRELANAQGFPKDYILQVNSSYSKQAQISRIGNSVVPIMAEVLVRANLPELCIKKNIKTMEQLNKVLTA